MQDQTTTILTPESAVLTPESLLRKGLLFFRRLSHTKPTGILRTEIGHSNTSQLQREYGKLRVLSKGFRHTYRLQHCNARKTTKFGFKYQVRVSTIAYSFEHFNFSFTCNIENTSILANRQLKYCFTQKKTTCKPIHPFLLLVQII